MSAHRPRRCAARALRVVALVALTGMTGGAIAACDSAPPPPTGPLPRLTLDPERVTAAKVRAETAMLVRENEQRGWQCGYQEAWEAAIFEARVHTPPRWRAAATSSALGTSLILGLIAILGVLFLAFVLPRVKLAPQEAAQGDGPPPESTGALGALHALARRVGAGLGRVLRADYLDRAAATTRVEAIAACRDLARRVEATRDSVEALASAQTPLATELSEALSEWVAEVAVVHDRLVTHRRFAAEINPASVLVTLQKSVRTAAELRRDAALAEVASSPTDEATWTRWLDRVEDRPELPASRPGGHAAASWARPMGWFGLAALALAIPMCAAWMAAGAFPLFVALLFALGGLAAVVMARAVLFQAGRLPLLPGVADRLARLITWLATLTTLVVVASSMTTAESGLDLGDPPPVERPADLVPPPLPMTLQAPPPSAAPASAPALPPEAPSALPPEAPPAPR